MPCSSGKGRFQDKTRFQLQQLWKGFGIYINCQPQGKHLKEALLSPILRQVFLLGFILLKDLMSA